MTMVLEATRGQIEALSEMQNSFNMNDTVGVDRSGSIKNDLFEIDLKLEA